MPARRNTVLMAEAFRLPRRETPFQPTGRLPRQSYGSGLHGETRPPPRPSPQGGGRPQRLDCGSLRATDLLPALGPNRIVGAGVAAAIAAVLQRGLPERDVLEEDVVTAVVVGVGRRADVLPEQVA